jgi:YegS/Rv2252/BmrU family lipid kinase
LSRRFCIIINPIAGRGKTLHKIPLLKEAIASQSEAKFDLFYTEYHEHAIKLTETHAKDYDAIIAMGGDGTVNEVVRGVLGTDTVMGIIPEGRGNDFARCINLTENVRNCIRKLIDFNVMKIDVGKIDNQYFVNGFGVGFDGFVNRRNLKRKLLKGPFSYYYTLLESLLLYQPMNMEITVDGKNVPAGSVFLTAVGNGKYCGGGLDLNPYAEIDDGQLDICVVNAISKGKIIKNLKRLKDGSVNELKEVHILRGKDVMLKSNVEMPAHYDGELYQPQNNEVRLSIIEKAVKIIHG